MTLPYEIQDLDGTDYLMSFEFHKELDGQIVFDAAYTIQMVIDIDGKMRASNSDDYVAIAKWLSNDGEDLIYAKAQKRFA